MSFKDQLKIIKNNWLLIIIVLIILVLFSGGGDFTSYSGGYERMGMADYGMPESMGMPAPSMYPREDFAPEVEERKVTKTASLNTEVERNTFEEATDKIKSIVTSSESIILNENINKYGKDKKSYMVGYFNIKVDTEKYDAVIAQLKEIGEVRSFNENLRDVTGQYENLGINIKVEKERLTRYNEMYAEATLVEDKIELNDRIFDQERRIKYMEDTLKNIDKQIDYTTVQLDITEKRSDYANIVFVKISELITIFVDSFNFLFSLFFALIPWVLGIGIIIWLVKKFRK